MKKPSPYLRMRVLGAIENATGKTMQERIKNTARLIFIDEEGEKRSFTERTIATWYYRYRKHGITGVASRDRADKGKARKITPEELMEAINQVLPLFKDTRRNRIDIYRMCIKKGILRKEQISQTGFYRYVRDYELLSDKVEHNKRRLAFAMEHANDLWQADTMFGPYIKGPKGKMVQTKLIAFIDDASRIICHAQFFHNETVDSLITAIRSAFYKRGVPRQLYVDNGSIYCSKEITLICARVGCILRHTPVRDGASKGKIERFFRRLRDQLLIRELDLSSIDELNKQLNLWVEEEYNGTNHSAIGMTPLDRFALDMKQVRFLPPGQVNDELFYAEETRKVNNDNTFSFKNISYEVPAANCIGKQITIRFSRHNTDRVIVFYKNNRLGEARIVDLVANSRIKRERIK